jgi:type I restriction-modification system DNA methylase subunit
MADLAESLREFGADPSALRLLDDDGPDLLPYATLVTARRSSAAVLGIVGGVYEWQNAPLVFLVDADLLDSDDQLHRIRRLLAMRGDAPYLGVVAPGRLDVYRIALDNQRPGQSRVELDLREGSRQVAFAQLGNKRPRAAISQRNWISNVVLSLLTGSITKLIKSAKIRDEDAISLVGRALFTRFLADRNLLPDKMADTSVAASLFDNRESAEKTSAWLDFTFNGDLLPLSEGVFDHLAGNAYQILGDVLRRAPDSQLFLGWEEKWDNLDFAHIPVGVLSQAYELYLRNHAPLRQRREGGYYTPRPIADLIVRASFRALERNGKSSFAKVLDPAAGAGVFLLTALRELVAERWKYDGVRPTTRILRAILYQQIVGFDINEAALRFAALGLYLMSIELDPEPKPVDKLRFENLRGTVLRRITSSEETPGSNLGSLGPLVGDEHREKYDIVIGNPPWSSGTKLPDWEIVKSTVGRIAADRGLANQSPPLPNEGLDLPFVWRAMEWAKPDGQIAFALHARLLFQQGDGMIEARRSLFDAIDVTSVINGAELRQTKVWPEISAPFCIIFATNRPAGPGSGFRLISPRFEGTLNEAGGMRIDALNADIVPARQLAETPDILKILFRGTKADLGLVERIRAQGHLTLEALWREAIGVSDRGLLRGSGNGYQKLRPSSRVRQRGDGLPGVDASYLHGRPEITGPSLRSLIIDYRTLGRFRRDRIHDRRAPELFIGPLAIVHKSPSARFRRIGVAVSDVDVIFNTSFYGYSPVSHPHAAMIARYIALIVGSKFALWMALVTSGEFGFERETIEKATIDRIPVPDFRKFTSIKRAEIMSVFNDLYSGAMSWDDVDAWVARLYGLGSRDLQVISDTLEFGLPFAENRKKAQATPNWTEIVQFCKTVQKELSPWSERFGNPIFVRPVQADGLSPWYGIKLYTEDFGDILPTSEWDGLLRAADEAAASEILVQIGNGELLIGRLAQRRYWSNTQARLLAQRIIWSHLDVLKGHAQV